MRSIHWFWAICLVGLTAPAAYAEQGFQGSYIGVSVSGDRGVDTLPSLLRMVNQSGWVFDEALRQYRYSRPAHRSSANEVKGNQFQGRVDFAHSPVSLRGTVFLGETATAALPALSYDLAIGRQTNLYAGVGYAVVNAPNLTTPLGRASGVVLSTGVETAAGKNLVVFGDAKLNLNEKAIPGESKLRFQFGAGLRF